VTFGSLSARASSARAEPLLGIAHYAQLRIQGHQQVISSQMLRAARKTPCRGISA
jgi:hypothetical protein